MTMAIGYDKPLYVLPFDCRATFSKEMFCWQEPLSPEQTTEIISVKRVIYDGLKAAVADRVPKDRACVLVDEEFGAAILHDARKQGLITAYPAEKSGEPQAEHRDPQVGAPTVPAPEFEFEYGSEYARHIEQFVPTFCKVLVRYNPGGDKATNRRQASRLRQLSDYLQTTGRKLMFELLVPPNPAQLQRLGNDKKTYDVQLRPTLTVQAIHELQDSGVEADVWTIEGFQRKADCQRVVAAARRVGRDTVGCMILGRHDDEQTVRQWLLAAAGVPGYIGFAVGRATFLGPLVDYRDHRITRDTAVERIATSYRVWVDLFETEKMGPRTAASAQVEGR
jgi:5-dehydro-2-deoxygluconokinase